jgi:hypothetical protein
MAKLYPFLLLYSLFGIGQKIPFDDWVELLKDNSNSQFKNHYFIYLQIQKLDTASRIKAAAGIEKGIVQREMSV